MSNKTAAADLKRLEGIYQQIQYKIRYEKGNFQSGYCLVQNKKVVVVNQFYTTEARVQCLLELLKVMEYDHSLLSEEDKKWTGING